MKTMEYFWDSVMPSQSKDKGIQDIEGSGLRMDMMGSKIALQRVDLPKNIPAGTAMADESANPVNTLRALSRMCIKIERSWYMTIPRSMTLEGGGKKRGSTRPILQMSSQIARKVARERTPINLYFSLIRVSE